MTRSAIDAPTLLTVLHDCRTILQAEYLAVAKLQADALITADRELAKQAAGLVVLASIEDLTSGPR